MTSEEMKKVFLDLEPGDSVSWPGEGPGILVLRVKVDGSKLFAEIDGDYANPFPCYLRWDESTNAPAGPGTVIPYPWVEAVVNKGVNPKLAELYRDFPIDEDYITEEAQQATEKVDMGALRRVAIIGKYCEAGDTLATIAMLKTLGVEITDEQAFVVLRVQYDKYSAHSTPVDYLLMQIIESMKSK